MVRERAADGFVLIVVLLAIMLLSALGSALVLTTSTESRIAANFGGSAEGLDAAEAIVELSLAEIVAVPDWNQLLNGSARSSFVDGGPTGSRQLADGSVIDLSQVVDMANCEVPTPCAGADMDVTTADRPWGLNNPRWTLFAYGRLSDVLPGRIDSPYYVILLVGDDPAENDNDPATDGTGGMNPGSGVIALRAEAFGVRGAHKAVELTVTRGGGIARVLTWHEVR
jgi:hypothetical protein